MEVTLMESGLQEIRREKVFVPQNMTTKEIIEKYSISSSSANVTRKRGWFIKNYSRNQIIIDRSNFDPKLSYSIAKQVFWKRFRKNPVAVEIKDDLIQEAVSLMFMQSGKVKEGANERYWWVAYNAMMTYLKKWINKTQCECELKEDLHPMMFHGNRRWSPEYGWSYC
jgi:hypothetical protein